MSTTLKDLYLAAHTAAIAADTAGLTAGLDMLDAARTAFNESNFVKLDWPSFQAHFDETIRKLSAFAKTPAPSVVETNRLTIAQETADKLARIKAAQDAAKTIQPVTVAVPTPAPVPAVKVVPAVPGTPAIAPAAPAASVTHFVPNPPAFAPAAEPAPTVAPAAIGVAKAVALILLFLGLSLNMGHAQIFGGGIPVTGTTNSGPFGTNVAYVNVRSFTVNLSGITNTATTFIGTTFFQVPGYTNLFPLASITNSFAASTNPVSIIVGAQSFPVNLVTILQSATGTNSVQIYVP